MVRNPSHDNATRANHTVKQRPLRDVIAGLNRKTLRNALAIIVHKDGRIEILTTMPSDDTDELLQVTAYSCYVERAQKQSRAAYLRTLDA
jgi:hypothetical protein